ncbi:unnamed protein product [Rhizoctonia solani]|uniref:Protein kinase domain-containing protein n=1 Tax=Rhizoctonia solani TaxID=456999 RepID=A0A8H3AKS4_9AGAM|nr:unnamed protein product [Rhizoctonia solani]
MWISGVYVQPGNRANIQIVIKSARVSDLESKSEKTRQRTQKNLLRELTVWNSLQRNPHQNILSLLGVAYMPSSRWLCSISEYCQSSLEAYFKHPPKKPEYIRFANVLLSFDGIVKLCDFGQARFHNDQRGLASDASTTFESTHRFMSPELFLANHKVRPTNLSDVWAYGCVALQLLSRLRPYHTIKNDHAIANVVMSGRSPSSKPEKPHAPRCLNDYLWNVIEWCWKPLEYRPTTARLLNELNRLIDNNLIDILSLTPDRMSLDFDGAMPSWPESIVDFGGQGSSPSRKLLCRGARAELWIHQEATNATSQATEAYVVKAPTPPTRLRPRKTKLDPFQYLLRRVVRERYSLQHQNIVEMLGIDTSFGIYTGLVFEFCENLSLEAYKANEFPDQFDLVRYATQILEGLQYLHTFPTPIAHGDLNPSNIMVDARGTLKLTTFSLSQIAASIPQVEPTVLLASRVEVIRYLSPEMMSDAATPSVKSDMWAYGCVVFWLFANLEPYHETKREQDVEKLIQRGNLPNDAQLLREEAEVDGRFRQNSRREWLFNGISDRAESCWSSSGWPSATDFLSFIGELSGGMDELEGTSAWMSGASNLSGTIVRPPIMWVQGGSTSGSWRYSNASRRNLEQRITSANMKWTKASFKRGLFRSQTEVIIKFSMSGKSSTGSSHHIASRSAIKHETAILAQLRHSNICSLWGYEEDTFGSPSLPAIVTEFCPNGTLREVTQYLNQHSDKMDISTRLRLIQNVLKGVNYLHEEVTEGVVVHGNLNTDTSIVVDKHGAAKLRNFEFAFQYAHTKSPGVVATIIRAPALAPVPSRWHPPEMFSETSGSDWPLLTRYNDLWTLGCLLVAIYSNLEPYSSTDVPAVFARIANKEKPYSKDDCSHIGVWNVAERLWGTSIIDRVSVQDALEEIGQYTS